MDHKQYGGVSAKDVIVFQTKIMMGTQFGRIIWAREHKSEDLGNSRDEILIACLRMGWNDAFRHTSQNESGINDERSGAAGSGGKKDKYMRPRFKRFRGIIKEEPTPQAFDDYYSNRVISDPKFLDIFKTYAKTAVDKHTVIDSEWETIKDCFRGVKKLDGQKRLSLGHIQKMFNIAVKLYLCLYICREELGLRDLFIQEIVDNFANADCPVDSIILGELEQIEMEKRKEGAAFKSVFGQYIWSQLNAADYEAIQKKVHSESKGNSNLWFDFAHWN